MISCQKFRANLRPGSDDAAMLEHLRKCDGCLDYATGIDPELFFRSIGGEELTPPGGVDAFAAEVMSQVRLRQTEGFVGARRFLIPPRRLAAAAVLTATVGLAALLFDQSQKTERPKSVPVVAAVPAQLTTKPVVETYASKNATIVEMPAEANDAKVIMIFDESLPADL
jgi:hypothetical protein